MYSGREALPKRRVADSRHWRNKFDVAELWESDKRDRDSSRIFAGSRLDTFERCRLCCAGETCLESQKAIPELSVSWEVKTALDRIWISGNDCVVPALVTKECSALRYC